MIIVGFDPGLQGGLSIIDDGDLIAVYDMPTVSVSYNKKTRKEVDGPKVWDIINGHSPNVAIIESVHAMSGQGVTGMFRFGQSFGVVIGVCNSFHRDMELQFVTPQKWKRYFYLIGTEKDEARLLCIEKFPYMKDKFKLKKSSGIADSSLIATYGYFLNDVDSELNNEV